MKIEPQHYLTLRSAIEPIAFHAKRVSSEQHYQHLGVSPKRLRWDMLYASQIKIGDGRGMDGMPLYAYMNDDHIDTALRAICKEFDLNWAASQ